MSRIICRQLPVKRLPNLIRSSGKGTKAKRSSKDSRGINRQKLINRGRKIIEISPQNIKKPQNRQKERRTSRTNRINRKNIKMQNEEKENKKYSRNRL